MPSYTARDDRTQLKPAKVAKRATLPPLYPVGCADAPLYPDANSWDAVVIGSLLPGRAKCSGAALAVKVDPKSAHGRNGGRPTISGVETQKFTVEVEVQTNEQVAELDKITAELANDMATDPGNAAFRFDAPAVRSLGISLVIIQEISQYEEGSRRNTLRRRFTLRQFMPPDPVPAVGQPKKAQAKAQGKKRDPNEVEKAADAKAAAKGNPRPTDQPGQLGPTGEAKPKKELSMGGEKMTIVGL